MLSICLHRFPNQATRTDRGAMQAHEDISGRRTLLWPSRVHTQTPSKGFQIFAVVSADALASSVSSGEKLSATTAIV